MQALLGFLMVSMYLGFASQRRDVPVPKRWLLLSTMVLAVLMLSRRFLL